MITILLEGINYGLGKDNRGRDTLAIVDQQSGINVMVPFEAADFERFAEIVSQYQTQKKIIIPDPEPIPADVIKLPGRE